MINSQNNPASRRVLRAIQFSKQGGVKCLKTRKKGAAIFSDDASYRSASIWVRYHLFLCRNLRQDLRQDQCFGMTRNEISLATRIYRSRLKRPEIMQLLLTRSLERCNFWYIEYSARPETRSQGRHESAEQAETTVITCTCSIPRNRIQPETMTPAQPELWVSPTS